MNKWDNKFGLIEIKCKFLKADKCTNYHSLFLGYSKEFCKLCLHREYHKCCWEAENNECFALMPDSQQKCRGYENCKGYIEDKEA